MLLSLVFVRRAGDIALSSMLSETPEKSNLDAETIGRETVASPSNCERGVVEFVRAGRPFECSSQELETIDSLDDDLPNDTTISVYPALFDAHRPHEFEQDNRRRWRSPVECFEYGNESPLWRGYDSVRPTVETIETDRDHGSSTLSVRALEVLRDEALLLAAGECVSDSCGELAVALMDARPTMTVLQNRIARAVASAESDDPTDVAQAAHDAIEPALSVDDTAARNASERVDGKRVATLSRSGTVERTLREGNPSSLLVARSLPGGEGVKFAERLCDVAETTVTSDAAFPGLLRDWDTDVFLVGADSILADGRVVNKVGTFAGAVAAKQVGAEVIVVTATDKISPETTFDPEYQGQEQFSVMGSVSNPTYEATALSAVTAVITENGPLTAEDIRTIAEEHEDNRTMY